MSREASVIGKPISHSLSPAIFSFLAYRAGLADFHYSAQEISPENLSSFTQGFRANPNGVGFNVTIPHKETIQALVDECTPESRAIGAINVVHKDGNLLRGHNTDVYGVLRTLEKYLGQKQDEKALIFGAGGAARASAYALGLRQASMVTILNRNIERAKALAKEFQELFPKTQFQAISELKAAAQHTWDILIQSTPLGMHSQPKTRDGAPASEFFLKIKDLHFARDALAFDLIYQPEWTPFLGIAKNLGLKTVGGLEMLIEQALQTWKIWLDDRFEREKIDTELADFLRNRPIFLTGFMGAGKSTIGPLLAQRLNWNFVETDKAIEKEAGLSIPEIFKQKGEPFFRELEKKVVQRAAFTPKTVISLGGGALNQTDTRELVKKIGRSVYVSASLPSLVKRLDHPAQKRPLLAGLTSNQRKAKIEALLKEREPFYHQCSFNVDTDFLSAEQAAKIIAEHFL